MIKTTRQVAEDILKHQYFLLKLIQPARTPVVQAINSLPQGAGQLHITFCLCDVCASVFDYLILKELNYKKFFRSVIVANVAQPERATASEAHKLCYMKAVRFQATSRSNTRMYCCFYRNNELRKTIKPDLITL